MAGNILSGSDKTTHVPFGLLPGVALHCPTILDCADIIHAKASHAQATVGAVRELLERDPARSVDDLLDNVEYALATIKSASGALLAL